jgi:ribokinase
MADIIILGIFVADAAYRTEKMPVTGQTLLGTGFQLGPGGKGSNQAVAAAKAGGDVAFLSRIGADTFGQMGRDVWAGAGVTAMVNEDPARPTGSAGIFIEEATGKNAIVVVPGAAGALSAADVEARAAEIAGARVAMTQLEQPMEAAHRFLQIAAAAGVSTILNPAPAADLPGGMLELCDYVTPNETEAEELTGVRVTGPDDALEAARGLLAKGVRKGTLITLGEQGSLFWDGARAVHTPPMTAGPVVDTTGAGDAFNGGFATALAAGQALDDALRFAAATAALSVTKHGTAASMPTRAEIDRLL